MHQHSGYNRPVSLKGHVYYSRSQAVVEIVRGFEVWFSPGFITQYFLKFLETPSMRIPGKLGFPEFSNTACNVQEDPENGRWPSSAFFRDRWHITWDKVKLRHTTNNFRKALAMHQAMSRTAPYYPIFLCFNCSCAGYCWKLPENTGDAIRVDRTTAFAII